MEQIIEQGKLRHKKVVFCLKQVTQSDLDNGQAPGLCVVVYGGGTRLTSSYGGTPKTCGSITAKWFIAKEFLPFVKLLLMTDSANAVYQHLKTCWRFSLQLSTLLGSQQAAILTKF